MKKTKKSLLCLISFAFICLMNSNQIFISQNIRIKEYLIQNEQQIPFNDVLKPSADKENHEIIEEIFSQKLADYSNFGYFPQAYKPSLQATYYALYILKALGKLDQVNQTEIENYIMIHYDATSNVFVDSYAFRYLDADNTLAYFPLSTLLEVNCYAILSLNILDRLDLINEQESIDFIWSCFHPEGPENGFIGQPYDVNIINEYKIATMDNTYFAVKTLDVLMDDWSGYLDEKRKIISFVNTLQNSDGSFKNDLNMTFSSLFAGDNNLQAAYYCVKTLDILGMLDTINMANFHSYLENLYLPDQDMFCFFSPLADVNDNNVFSTSMGLDLSNLTGFTNYDRDSTIQFVLNNRNSLGNWDRSTVYQYHELIDTFQIIRSFNESGIIEILNEQERNEISSAISSYQQSSGFSHLSNDYMSINLMYTITKSFELYDRIPDLDINSFYMKLQDNYRVEHGFLGCTNMNRNYILFRSYPTEYFSPSHRSERIEPNWLYTPESTYKALYTLLKTFKLDDFEMNYDLNALVNNIIGSQFLEPGYENFGGFLPYQKIYTDLTEHYNKSVYLKYSYYAIKSLELLTSYLDLGSILNLTINKGALYGFIQRNIAETASTIHFDPKYTSDIETILMNTYQMIYILKALNLYGLNDRKIEEFVRQHVNYDNIMNIYYSFKISEILGFNIKFDYMQTRNAINILYSGRFKEFFITSDYQEIEQDAFLWVCDMIKNDKLAVECNYTESLNLGSVNTITAKINNIVFDKFNPDYVVRFESPQFGSVDLEKQYDNIFVLNLMVPNDLDYYPCVEGFLNIYEKSKLIRQVPIFFTTSYEFDLNHEVSNNNGSIHFEVNVSYKFSSKYEFLCNSYVEIDIYKNDWLYSSANSSREDFTDYSRFTFDYECSNDSYYCINVSFFDYFHLQGLNLFSIEQYPPPSQPPTTLPPPTPHPFKLEINGITLGLGGVVITSLVGVSTVKIGDKIKDKRLRRKGLNSENSKDINNKEQQKYKNRSKKNFCGKWEDNE